ncbi:MAG TPA: inositol monophosphatase family protein [Rhabdochlamydiaceae bacterium]|nr:inositol monophosphatase family protein [Rhabdochlamydiaceae bacterium]
MKSIDSYSPLTFAAVEAALKAGELLLSGFGTDYKISSKSGNQNLVTEYDLASQNLIVSTLKKQFPDHQFLGEEDKIESKLDNSKIVWIIDPLDGTVNFARSIPIFCVSIAAALGKEILTGVVYYPSMNELFVAEKNQGAYLNGKRIAVSQRDRFDISFMATGFPYDVDKDPLKCVERFASIVKKGIPIRRLGSAAIDLSYVACGRFDTFWEVGLHPWDLAAGKLLIEEAGGKVSHYDGREHQLYGYFPTLATNGHLHQKMVDLLKQDMVHATH